MGCPHWQWKHFDDILPLEMFFCPLKVLIWQIVGEFLVIFVSWLHGKMNSVHSGLYCNSYQMVERRSILSQNTSQQSLGTNWTSSEDACFLAAVFEMLFSLHIFYQPSVSGVDRWTVPLLLLGASLSAVHSCCWLYSFTCQCAAPYFLSVFLSTCDGCCHICTFFMFLILQY